jgi:hypothetical protein
MFMSDVASLSIAVADAEISRRRRIQRESRLWLCGVLAAVPLAVLLVSLLV